MHHDGSPPENLPLQEQGATVGELVQREEALLRSAARAVEKKGLGFAKRARRRVGIALMGTALAIGMGGAKAAEAGEKTTTAVGFMRQMFERLSERKQEEALRKMADVQRVEQKLAEIDAKRAELDSRLSAFAERMALLNSQRARFWDQGNTEAVVEIDDEIRQITEVGTRKKADLDRLTKERAGVMIEGEKLATEVQGASKRGGIFHALSDMAGRAEWELRQRDWERSLGIRR